MQISAGNMQQYIAHFQILEEIGRGGMGIVYKARDVRLHRYVAIKILTSALEAKNKDLQRFIHEARAASVLNHPNICTIYDVGETDGIHYIVMELIEGETLREILNRKGSLPEKEVIEIGLQICDALQAAHAKGIIHRDIKPENIMVAQERLVKVMDFGLAILLSNQNIDQKIINPPVANSARSSLLSSLSSFQGTISYMSPEQLENKIIDSRTDIFALGVVLFEMIYGKRPFQGASFVEIMDAILSEQPLMLNKKAHPVTKELSNIILKALNKDPNQRFQNPSDFTKALKQTNSYQKKLSQQPIKRKARTSLIVLFTILLFVLSWITSKIATRNSDPNSLQLFSNMQTTPLTNWTGLEEQPVFSPDGKRIAFHSDRSGNVDVWYQDLVSEQIFILTENSSFNDDWPCWSPDGNKIAFVSDRDGGGIYSIDLNSKEEHKISNAGRQPSWSPDGNAIAFITDSEKEICILNLNDKKDSTFFKVNDDDFLHTPRWSPDGNWLSFARGTGFRWNIWIKSTVDNKIFQVTHGNYMNYTPHWHLHTAGLFYYSDRSGVKDIWFQKIDLMKMTAQHNPIAVTKGAAVASFDLSPDGGKIAYATFHEQGNIYALALKDDGILQKGKLRKITNWNRFTCDPGISPDGTKIVMTSNIQGNYELWMCDRDGKNPRLAHQAHDLNESPVWSPVGNLILFVDGKAADRELKILDLQNESETFLTNNDYAEAYPDWSPDGKWIAYTIKDSDCNIWLIAPTGCERIQLTNQSTIEIAPHFSPDGKLVSFISDRDGYFNVWAIPISGGSPFQITFNKDQGKINLGHCWSADGKCIYYCRTIRGIRNIWKISVQHGRQEQLTFYTSATEHVSRGSRISTDGKELFFATYERTGDIWLMQDQSIH